MIPPLKPGARLMRVDGPVIETGDFTPKPEPAMMRAVNPPSLTVGRLSAA